MYQYKRVSSAGALALRQRRYDTAMFRSGRIDKDFTAFNVKPPARVGDISRTKGHRSTGEDDMTKPTVDGVAANLI